MRTRNILVGAALGALTVGTVVATPALATPSDPPPVITQDSYSTGFNQTLSISAPGVLANDLDPDGDQLTVVNNTAALHGTVSINPHGGFLYIPATNYTGPDDFKYTACEPKLTSAQLAERKLTADEELRCGTTTVLITVKGDTTPPPVTTTVTPPPTTTVVQPPSTTVVEHPPVRQAPDTIIIEQPSAGGSSGSFSGGQIGRAPSGSVSTGDGSLSA